MKTCWPWRLRLQKANIDLHAEISPEQSMLVSTLRSSIASLKRGTAVVYLRFLNVVPPRLHHGRMWR